MNEETDLPAGWVRVALGEVVVLSTKRFEPLSGQILPYLGLEHIEKHTGKILGKGESSGVSSTKTVFSSGDLLYGRLRPYLCKVALPDFEGVCSTDIIVFLKHDYLSNQFLKYSLLNQRFVDYAISKTGGQHPRISTDDLLAYKIVLPPLAEQNRIVARLETLFKDLDQTEDTLQQAKAQAKEYRQAVLRDAFSGKLTGSILQDGELPETWELMPLSNLGKWSGGGTPSKNEPKFWRNGNVLWVSPKDMKTSKILDTEDKITRDALDGTAVKLVEENSVLFVVRSGILKRKLPIAINKKIVTLNQDMLAFTPNKDLIKTDFVYWFMVHQSAAILANCSKSGMIDSIDTKLLREYEIVVPPIKIQDDALLSIQNEFNKISDTENALDNQLSQTQSLRQTLFQDAFAGKLIHQDPADEPARQLLERIKAEKIRMTAQQKQRDKATREAKKGKAKEPEVLKTILQVLQERGGSYPAVSVWRECEHKGDIDKFYAELKILMDSDNKVSEDQEKQNLFLSQ